MKRTKAFNVVIFDDNAFFAAGLKRAIEEYAEKNGLIINVTTDTAVSLAGYDKFIISLRNLHLVSGIWDVLSASPSRVALVTDTDNGINKLLCKGRVSRILRFFSLSELHAFFRVFFSGKRTPSPGRYHCPKAGMISFREIQTATMLAQGMSHADISGLLNITVKTVSNHKQNIMQKLNLSNKAEFALWLLRITR
ncbi:helix-turn-helix transcriptional regulator [Citrobacter koseri]|uniref:helix-turn-helix transcriptional regulator n=1 Tax=Citrobacter koseri TaxID=545 RepID=UPI001A2E5AED|nr:LuxR C-terminal-related transcriptional regulator [Citrobacter koseri]MDT7487385.1 LuxR C-terminal-related transcriptional regulator [Citrobacter koseri]HAT3905072.1 hypothetical protein [Citrobacter koseri]HAU5607705.1 hypothetical protein [Citrobacter koseri]HDQ2585288.1 hypothetical protein [Citrobacter koseri]